MGWVAFMVQGLGSPFGGNGTKGLLWGKNLNNQELNYYTTCYNSVSCDVPNGNTVARTPIEKP